MVLHVSTCLEVMFSPEFVCVFVGHYTIAHKISNVLLRANRNSSRNHFEGCSVALWVSRHFSHVTKTQLMGMGDMGALVVGQV